MADADDPPFPAPPSATGGSGLALRAARERLRQRMFGHSRQRPRLGRYALLEPLGAGGMGEVFLAEDAETGEQVALKVLRDDRPEALSRLKSEFRAVSDLHHPGLVRLGELDAEGPVPYFTMECVQGAAFDEAMADALSRGRAEYARDLLLRLTDALETLHGHGRLHRDLKPSNVLVTATGRVVVLDFGLTSELASDGLHRTRKGRVLGTPAFMAPEQLSGQRLGPSADWYGVGAMLASAMLGEAPEPGGRLDEAALAASPHPAAFKTLALALCHPDADRRAGGAQIRVAFGLPGRRARPGEVGVFVGREGALDTLCRLCAAPGQGARLVFLEGEGGIGKSALLSRFAARFEARTSGLVVSGRCRERERAPFKGLDEIVPELTAHLNEAFDAGRPSVPPPSALSADSLRQDVQRLAGRHPLVLVLDDAQWAGRDTAVVLSDLVRTFHGPPFTLMVSGRFGSARVLRDELQVRGGAPEEHHLRLDALAEGDAATLVRSLDPRADAARVEALCRAAQGHPRWLSELTVAGADASTRPADLYARALAEASAPALSLLRVVAASVGPLPLALAARLAEVASEGMALSQQLSRQRLLSMCLREGEWELSCPWPPVRDAALAGASEAVLMRLHAALARELSARPGTPAATLLEHLRQAGAVDLAIDAAERAGDEAVDALAYHAAAGFYAEAEQLAPRDPNQRSRLLRKRADALAAAGCADEADACFRAATECAADPRTLELAVASWRAFQRALAGRR